MFIRTERSIREFMHNYPIVTLFIVINLVVWFITSALPFGDRLLSWGIGHNLSIYAANEYRRLFTPIFFHANFMHVLMNSFSLVIFGPALEQMLGKYKFTIGYLAAGIIGNLGTYLVQPTSVIFHLGASGAVYGLFGFYMFMVMFRKDLIDQRNAQIVITIFIIGLVFTFLTPRINVSAHVFGFLGGLAVSPILLKGTKPFSIYRIRRVASSNQGSFDPNRWENKRRSFHLNRNLLWGAFLILIILGIIGWLL